MADAAADGCDDSVGSYSWHLAGGADENICRYCCISTLREEYKYAIFFFSSTDCAACDRGYSAADLSY